MARFAELLGKDAAPYRQKADELKDLVNRKFFNPETGVYAEGTQTAQAIASIWELYRKGKSSLWPINFARSCVPTIISSISACWEASLFRLC